MKSSAILAFALAMLLSTSASEMNLIKPLRETARRAISEFNQIDAERKADNTPQEKATYDERCQQIAREMFYMMSQVNKSVAFTN